jgi:hypothetical protein
VSGARWEIEASAGPARAGLVGGGAQLLVRVALFGDRVEDPHPDAFIDLRPSCARHLALELLAAAEDAERQTRAAGFSEARR